jgi:tight adherence protein C
MNLLQIGVLILLFCSVAALAMFAFQTFGPNALRGRLRRLMPAASAAADPVVGGPTWWRRAEKVSRPFAKLSLPEGEFEQGSFRVRFFNAGLRDPSAPTVYFGTKTAIAVVLPVVLYLLANAVGADLSFNAKLGLLLGSAAFGYYLPNLVLSSMIDRRKREIFESFPDALDLMTVCVEAGLGMDAAIKKVAEEIGHKSLVLSEELHLVSLDLRAGSDRQRALRNLAMRTGVDEVQTWVAMLIQSDRFGTSIGASLRIHSDMLRTKRRQRAEETAAKISVKLMFPLMVCIFPALLMVLAGPPFIQIYRVLIPTMNGGR